MQLKILSKRTILIFALAGSAIFLVLFFNFFSQSPGLPDNSNGQAQKNSVPLILSATALSRQEQASLPDDKADFGLPMRLKISGINVDAAVESVGLTSEGLMDVPRNSANVAWYNLGQRPGESGNAVFAGHYGWENGSVFDNLHKLLPGDKLYVEDDKGEIASFVVRESRSYDPNADASAVFNSNDGKSHLNLITCEGVWDKIAKKYPKRLVVFTDKE